jgi:hypothetical protein
MAAMRNAYLAFVFMVITNEPFGTRDVKSGMEMYHKHIYISGV